MCCYRCVAALYQPPKNKRRKRKKWTHDWLLQRKNKGSYGSIFSELSTNSELFQKYMRFSYVKFQFLLEKITHSIQKNETHLRLSIPAGARLEATLLYLISRLSYSRLQFETRISVSSLCKIIPETCDAIYQALKNDSLKVVQ